MNSSEIIPSSKFHIIRSMIAVIIGTLILRAAASIMGQNIQFYFNAIHEAALNPQHPLHQMVGANNVYPISYTLGGIIIASFYIAELLGALLLGAWSDRIGRKLFIIFGPLFGAIAVLITSVTTVIPLLVLTRLLEGLSTASNAPATLGYIAETTSENEKMRIQVVGFYEVATIGGMALGFSVGGWLWQNYGQAAFFAGIPLTSPAFAINALVYGLSLLILWLGIKEVRERVHPAQQTNTIKETLKKYWKILSNPKVAGFAPAWIAINGVIGVWSNLFARILTDKHGINNQLLSGLFNNSQAGNIMSVYSLLFILGIIIWSVFFTGMRRNTAMLIGTGGLFASCLLLFAINHQTSIDSPWIMPLAVLMVIAIMVQSGFTPAALAHLADITEDYTHDRGAIMGLYSVFFGVGQFFGSSLGGIFVDGMGADGMILFISLLGFLAAGLLIYLRRLEHQHQIIK